MPSIVEVSRVAGVSSATVSNVINGKPWVKGDTAGRVHKAMKEIGYVPLPPDKRSGPRQSGSHNKSLKTGNIGFLFGGSTQKLFQVPLYSKMVSALRTIMAEKDLGLMLVEILEGERSPSVISRDRIDGIVGSLMSVRSEQIGAAIRGSALPSVSVFGHIPANSKLLGDHFEPANDAIGELAAQYLIDRGHKKIAMVNPAAGRHPAFDVRQMFFAHYARHNGIEVELFEVGFPDLVDGCVADFHKLPAVQEFCAMLKVNTGRPTGIFVPCDGHLVVLQKAIWSVGIIPGKDIEFIGCNNDQVVLGGLSTRPATIDIDIEMICRAAVERLMYRINTGNGGPYLISQIMPKCIVPGDTVKS
jgi:LacI family transcriptional regulator